MTIGTICIIVGVVLVVLLKIFFKDTGEVGQKKGVDNDDLFKEEPEFDRTWSHLPGNIFNDD